MTFPDLSLTIIKLLGPGEYAAELPGANCRRTLRPCRPRTTRIPPRPTAAIRTSSPSAWRKRRSRSKPVPYDIDELTDLARHCTEQEDAANKVERQVEQVRRCTPPRIPDRRTVRRHRHRRRRQGNVGTPAHRTGRRQGGPGLRGTGCRPAHAGPAYLGGRRQRIHRFQESPSSGTGDEPSDDAPASGVHPLETVLPKSGQGSLAMCEGKCLHDRTTFVYSQRVTCPGTQTMGEQHA